MKRTRVILVIVSCMLAVLLAGCAGSDTGDESSMYVGPATLSEDEESVSELLGGNNNGEIFDYNLDGQVKSAHVARYRLKGKKWVKASGSLGSSCESKTGRIALCYDMDRYDGNASYYRIALQSNRGVSEANGEDTESKKFKNLLCSWASIGEKTTVKYEEEIPLAVQIYTSKDEVSNFIDEDLLKHPEEYAEAGHEAVYLFTVKFSKKPLE